MTTVAEGVETPEQFEILAHMGCDQTQGYLHSRPMSAGDIEPLIRNGVTNVIQKSPLVNQQVTSIALRG
jgi:EAL domain-containing protein (putative c-di-GMP-specific phosphodiesterase class I)